ncbi:MAG: hypothetical protein AAB372_04000 [Patescibacteria group bacterium]
MGIIAMMLLLPSYFFLQFQIDALESQLTVMKSSENYQKTKQGDKDTRVANTTISALISFEKGRPKVVAPLEDILGRVSEDIALSTFSYLENTDGSIKVLLGGRANRRDAYLTYIANLQKSPYIKTTIVPSSTDLIKERDIIFNISFPVSISSK